MRLLFLVAEESSDRNDAAVVRRPDTYAGFRGRGIDDRVVADVDSGMTDDAAGGVEDDIARHHFIVRDGLAHQVVQLKVAVEVDTEVGVDGLDEAGAVGAVGQAFTGDNIGIADELAGKAGEILADAGILIGSGFRVGAENAAVIGTAGGVLIGQGQCSGGGIAGRGRCGGSSASADITGIACIAGIACVSGIAVGIVIVSVIVIVI